ncbi:MAG: AarF/UbiB family protein, partial [Candidatus Omnitrophica bacterium]|nr:AarF/UbiB family protein [Candidatus Omnitrophota bacterium]
RGASIVKNLMDMEEELSQLSFADRLVTLLRSLGPVGTKIGQVLSENQQIIPSNALRSKLASLKDRAAEISKMAIIESLLAAGYSLESFSIGEMLGSASIKQVHRGKLRLPDGTIINVVFKVVKPNLNRTVSEDLLVFQAVLAYLNKEKGRDLGELYKSVKKMLDEETDLANEGRNAEELNRVIEAYYADNPGLAEKRGHLRIKTPHIIRVPGTDNTFVMVEEEVQGLSCTELMEGSSTLRRNLPELRQQIRRHLLYQIFTKGVFHADPHGSNIMVSADAIYLIDTGLIGRFTDARQMQAVKGLVKGILLEDSSRVIGSIEEFLATFGESLPERQKAKLEMEAVFKKHSGNISAILNETGALVLKNASQNSRDPFGKFIKAFSQSLWLFPINLAEGRLVLDDLAQATEMSSSEKTKIMSRYLRAWTGTAVSGSWSKVSAAIRGAVTRTGDLREQLRKRRLLQEAQKDVGKAETRPEKTPLRINPAKGPARRAQSSLRDKPKPFDKIVKISARVSENDRGIIYIYEMGPPEINESVFQEVQGVYPEVAPERLREVIEVFTKIDALIQLDPHFKLDDSWTAGHFGYPLLSAQDRTELGIFSAFEKLGLNLQWIIVRTLTNRYLRQKYSLDYFGFGTSALTCLADKITDYYLAMLDARDFDRPIELRVLSLLFPP